MSTLANRLHAVLIKEGMASTPTPPVSPPPPVVVPPPTPVGIGSGLSGLGLISDDFTGYANTAALQAQISSTIGGKGNYLTCLYGDGYNAQLVSIDTSVLYNGHQTMKYSFPGGVQTYPGLWPSLQGGKKTSKMWFRCKIRFSPGWSNSGVTQPPDPNSAYAYKLLGWSWDTYDGSGRLEIPNGNQYYIYWTQQAKGSGATVGSGPEVQCGTITTEWTDGGWYDYIIEVDYTKPTGVARVWIAKDGQTPVLRGTTSGTMVGGAAWPGIVGVRLGLNFNQTRAANQNQALWYGSWEMISGIDHPDPYGLGF